MKGMEMVIDQDQLYEQNDKYMIKYDKRIDSMDESCQDREKRSRETTEVEKESRNWEKQEDNKTSINKSWCCCCCCCLVNWKEKGQREDGGSER